MYKSTFFSFIFLALALVSGGLQGMESDAVNRFKASITEANKKLDGVQLLGAINSITAQFGELSDGELKELLSFLGEQIHGLDSPAIQVQNEQGNSTATTQESSFGDWFSQGNDSNASCADLCPVGSGWDDSDSSYSSGNWSWPSAKSSCSSSSSSSSKRSSSCSDTNSSEDDGNGVITAVVVGAAVVATVACLLWCFCRKSDSDDSQVCAYAQDASQRLASLMETIVAILRDHDRVPLINQVMPHLELLAENSITLRGALDRINSL